MLVFTPDEMKCMEEAASLKGITNEMLMEEAGKGIAHIISKFTERHGISQKALVLAGKGNNGGDGYVVARHLLHQGFSVQVWQTDPIDPSSLTKKMRRRFEIRSGKVIDIDHLIPDIPTEGIIIDAIFGTGFTGEPDEKKLLIFEKINQANLPVVAVDVPSGLDSSSGAVIKDAIHATLTCTVEYPKIGFFLKNGWNYVGALVTVPIGLAAFSDKNKAFATTLEEEDVQPLLPQIIRNRHKYKAGHIVSLAGSKGMTGASLLASYASLKAGAGIVHLLHNEDTTAEFAGSCLEVVKVPYKNNDLVGAKEWIERASACFFGPGLGTEKEQFALLDALWPYFKKKTTVIDADAISWLRTINEPLSQSILTPHLGELQKLIDIEIKEGTSVGVMNACQAFVNKKNTHMVVKGGPTFLFSPNALPKIAIKNDPGMATAGAGDVLTGILAALLAQGLSPLQAMHLGVYLHGTAGICAAKEETSYCITASSLIAYISSAYKVLLGQNFDLVQPWNIVLNP